MRRTRRGRDELPPTAGLPLRLGDFIARPKRSFLEGVACFLDIPAPIPACSGTATLIVALHTLRRLAPARDEVVLPAYTCPLALLAVSRVPGLRAVICDTQPGGFDFDTDVLKSLCGPRTLAILPTHLGGRVARVSTAMEMAADCGAFVVEDAAQALGARENGRSVGLAGDVGFFSLAVGKGLTTYEGGLLFSRRPELQGMLAEQANVLLQPRPFLEARRTLELAAYALLYRPSLLWHVYGRALHRELERNDEAAAVGDVFDPEDIPLHRLNAWRLRVAANALERLPDYLERGRARAASRLAALRSIEGISVLEDRPGTCGVWPAIMVLLSKKTQRDAALRELWRAGLGVSKLFVHALPDYDFLTPFLRTQIHCPNARALADRMLTLSNTHWMDEAAFAFILERLKHSLSEK